MAEEAVVGIVLIEMRSYECELCCKAAFIKGKRRAAGQTVFILNVLQLLVCFNHK
jgi:hypothetical protein